VLVDIGCSIGIAIGDCDIGHLDELMSAADKAMLSAKVAGKGRYVVNDDHGPI
jgi:GGDEF domain-containing protein